MSEETNLHEIDEPQQKPQAEGSGYAIDFDSDAPLVCNRDQSGDTTCESCQ